MSVYLQGFGCNFLMNSGKEIITHCAKSIWGVSTCSNPQDYGSSVAFLKAKDFFCISSFNLRLENLKWNIFQ